MARYNEILVGRYNRFLSKLFQIKGGAPAPQLAGDIGVSLLLNSGAENRYLEAWDLFGVTQGVAPVAAQFGAVRIRNISTRNVIAVFTKISVLNNVAAADSPRLDIGADPLADLGSLLATNVALDGRTQRSTSLVISFGTAAAPAFGNNFSQGGFPANVCYDFLLTTSQEVPLSPGQALQVRSNVANQNIGASFLWRERFLEESERT